MRRLSTLAALCGAGMLTVCAGQVAADTGSPGDVRDVDWYNTTVPVSQLGACPPQDVTFQDGFGTAGDYVYRITPGSVITYADVGGDRSMDALYRVNCGPRNSEYTTGLIAMTTDSAGAPQALGTVVDPESWTQTPADFTVWHGDVAVTMTDTRTHEDWTEYYRWAASAEAFVRVDAA